MCPLYLSLLWFGLSLFNKFYMPDCLPNTTQGQEVAPPGSEGETIGRADSLFAPFFDSISSSGGLLDQISESQKLLERFAFLKGAARHSPLRSSSPRSRMRSPIRKGAFARRGKPLEKLSSTIYDTGGSLQESGPVPYSPTRRSPKMRSPMRRSATDAMINSSPIYEIGSPKMRSPIYKKPTSLVENLDPDPKASEIRSLRRNSDPAPKASEFRRLRRRDSLESWRGDEEQVHHGLFYSYALEHPYRSVSAPSTICELWLFASSV